MRVGLTTRLLLPVGIVVVAAIAVVAAYSSRVATAQFERFEVLTEFDSPQPIDVGHLLDPLVQSYSTAGDWSEAAAVLANLSGNVKDRDLLLFDQEDVLVAATRELDAPGVHRRSDGVITIERVLGDGGRDLEIVQGQELPIEVHGMRVGTLSVCNLPLDDRHQDEGDSRAENFQGSLNRGLLLGVIAVGLVALGIAATLIGRTVKPIGALTHAAKRMADGDLSQRVPRASDDEVGDLSKAFNTMASSMERIETLRRNMVGDVAHELRTPLTNVRCQLEAIQDGLAPADTATIDSLHAEIGLLSRLVDDLQELTLASAGQLSLEPETLDLRAEVERAVTRCSAGSGIALPAMEVDVSQDLSITADSRRLQQILRNLLSNSLAHTPATGRIEILGREGDRFTEIEVCDSGAGIAPEHLDKVFERFYRADPARARGSGGAGLGLAIVRQLVELHGGSIGVESEPNRGTTFRLRFPKVPAR